jgi:hypothetical protein
MSPCAAARAATTAGSLRYALRIDSAKPDPGARMLTPTGSSRPKNLWRRWRTISASSALPILACCNGSSVRANTAASKMKRRVRGCSIGVTSTSPGPALTLPVESCPAITATPENALDRIVSAVVFASAEYRRPCRSSVEPAESSIRPGLERVAAGVCANVEQEIIDTTMVAPTARIVCQSIAVPPSPLPAVGMPCRGVVRHPPHGGARWRRPLRSVDAGTVRSAPLRAPW